MQGGVAAEGDLIGEGLACRRGGRLVFAGLDCRLGPGDALVLTGGNGSGKSSLLRLLAGLLTPAAGRLSLAGAAIGDDPARYRSLLHYVGHLDAAKPALTAREMLAFWAALREAGSAAVEDAIAAALAAAGLEAVADWPCRWLSAGQRRRLALARLVAAPALIWLLDEPSAGLDADAERRLVGAIAAHRATGGRVALATHQPIAVAGAAVIRLEDFAAGPDAALAVPW